MLPMMLVISIVMGIVPLLGIAWTIATGTVTTVDGLFMSLILLTLSAVFFLNAYWELRVQQRLQPLRTSRLRQRRA